MRWRRTLIVWLIVMILFSLYNLLPIVTAPTIPPSTFLDPKVLTYNFTMDQPSSIQNNFTTQINLKENLNSYNIRAYVDNSFNLQSISALGEYHLNYTIQINGANALNANLGIIWRHENYGLSAQGPIPDLVVQENITNLHAGVNVIEFQFTQYSKLSQYGSGYFYEILGPFHVDVGSRPVSTLGPLALEAVVGVLLVPASHLVSLRTYKFRRKTQTLQNSKPTSRKRQMSAASPKIKRESRAKPWLADAGFSDSSIAVEGGSK